MLMAVIVCSLSAWCQYAERVSPVVVLGEWALSKSTFSEVKAMFNDNEMEIMENAPGNSETHAVGMDMEGKGDYALMWAIDANSDKTLKQVSFLCGSFYWNNIDYELKGVGYKLVEEGTATLGNGAAVPQRKYIKGNRCCLIQTLDRDMAQVIFKRNND